jgi:hypothetical protein
MSGRQVPGMGAGNSLLGEVDFHLLAEGTHARLFDKLRAHVVAMGRAWSSFPLNLTLPPLAALFLRSRPYIARVC